MPGQRFHPVDESGNMTDNQHITFLASAGRTATATSSNFSNSSYKGIAVVWNVSAVAPGAVAFIPVAVPAVTASVMARGPPESTVNHPSSTHRSGTRTP